MFKKKSEEKENRLLKNLRVKKTRPKKRPFEMSVVQQLGVFAVAAIVIKLIYSFSIGYLNSLMIRFADVGLSILDRNRIVVGLLLLVALLIYYFQGIYIYIVEKHQIFLRKDNKIVLEPKHVKFPFNFALVVFICFVFMKYVPAVYKLEIGKNFILFLTVFAFCFFAVRVIAYCARHYPFRI
jgi:hypothetical protein